MQLQELINLRIPIPILIFKNKSQKLARFKRGTKNPQLNSVIERRQEVVKQLQKMLDIDHQEYDEELYISFYNKASLGLFNDIEAENLLNVYLNSWYMEEGEKLNLEAEINKRLFQFGSIDKLICQNSELQSLQNFNVFAECRLIHKNLKSKQFFDIILVDCVWDNDKSIMMILQNTDEKTMRVIQQQEKNQLNKIIKKNYDQLQKQIVLKQFQHIE